LRRLWLPAHVIRQRIGTVLTGRWSKERDFQASGSFTFGSTERAATTILLKAVCGRKCAIGVLE